MSVRTSTYTRKRVLKNGEIVERVCTETYVAKTNRRQGMGKEIVRKKIINCNDKEKIDRIYAYMCEIGM
jgi:hypothetical protein